jgi:hypothetical protein
VTVNEISKFVKYRPREKYKFTEKLRFCCSNDKKKEGLKKCLNFNIEIISSKKLLPSLTLFFLNFGLKKEIINIPSFFLSHSILIDVSKLNIKQDDIINERFLFSPSTTQPSEIEAEIEEIEDDEYRYRTWKNTQIGLALGGSGIGMWFAYKGLNIWEKWMKEQEQKDIEEEIQMTGTYINPGAGNVETSIDPITGKKIQIKPLRKDELEK